MPLCDVRKSDKVIGSHNTGNDTNDAQPEYATQDYLLPCAYMECANHEEREAKCCNVEEQVDDSIHKEEHRIVDACLRCCGPLVGEESGHEVG